MTEIQTFASRAIALRSARRQDLAEGTYTLEKDVATGRHYIAAFSPLQQPEASEPTAEPVQAATKPTKGKGGRKGATSPVGIKHGLKKGKGEAGPVAQVREFVWANPQMPTKEIVAELCGKRGLNQAMVRTRISWIRSTPPKDPATRDKLLGRL